MNLIKGILFDLDNTLIDSLDCVWRCADHVLKDAGLAGIDREAALKAMSLKQDIFASAEPQLSTSQKEGLFDEFIRCYPDFLQYARILPKAREVLEEAKSRKLRLALVTSGSRDGAKSLLKSFGLSGFFEAVVGFEDTEQHKPMAQPLLKAASLIELEPNEVMVVGDTELDVIAGKRAGVTTVAVTTGVTPIERITREQPDFIIKDLGELPRILDREISARPIS
jgi:HAD superfamily hydrolase (TIGR01549 family)